MRIIFVITTWLGGGTDTVTCLKGQLQKMTQNTVASVLAVMERWGGSDTVTCLKEQLQQMTQNTVPSVLAWGVKKREGKEEKGGEEGEGGEEAGGKGGKGG